MIAAFLASLGPWSWIVIGLALLGLEIVIPGFFLLWIGLGALVTGALSFLFWEMSLWTWQVQAIVFAVFAIGFGFAGRRLMDRGNVSDQPMLNQRTNALVGRTATLDEPIRNGEGRVRLDDTVWMIKGPDLEAGTRVRIASATHRTLTVEPA